MELGHISDATTERVSKLIPIFREFDERQAAQIARLIESMTQSQTDVLMAETGGQIEILPEDLLALRKLDLLSIEQGDLVITELGQAVATELRRRAGLEEPTSHSAKLQLERAADLIQRAKEEGLLGGNG